MRCMKCGKETEDTNVFCEECLADMAKHPVKSGTAFHIPVRPAAQERSAPRTRERSAADVVVSLRTLIRWLTVTIAVLSLLLCLTAGFLIHTLDKQGQENMIGRNYSTDTSITNP